MTSIFYVYEHWRPDTNACFYVGKGKGSRAYNLVRNRHHRFIVKKLTSFGLEVEVRIIRCELTESKAFELERKRITHWRGLGVTLTNQTDGGEGVTGRVVSSETRAKLSSTLKGRQLGPPASASTRAKLSAASRGRKLPPASLETRARLSAAHTGVKHTEATRAKMSTARMGHEVSAETRRKLAARAGWKHSDEARAKMRGRVVSDETRQILREQRSGQSLGSWPSGVPRSVETRAKISQTLKGCSRSPEAIAKQRATNAAKRPRVKK